MIPRICMLRTSIICRIDTVSMWHGCVTLYGRRILATTFWRTRWTKQSSVTNNSWLESRLSSDAKAYVLVVRRNCEATTEEELWTNVRRRESVAESDSPERPLGERIHQSRMSRTSRVLLLAGSKKLQNLVAFTTTSRRKSESIVESPVVPGSRCKNRVIIRLVVVCFESTGR